MAIAQVYHKDPSSDCFSDLRTAVFDMSHWGQESYWFAVYDSNTINPRTGSGIPKITSLRGMKGSCGVGLNSDKMRAKPAYSSSPKLRDFYVAFEGHLLNGEELRERHGGRTDGELAARFIRDSNDFQKGIENLAESAKGHYSVLLATERGEAYGALSPLGVRPLIYGKGEKGSAVVSESRALSHIGMERERDIRPGEIFLTDDLGLHTLRQLEERRKICSFLWAYYSMPNSEIEGREIDIARKNIGRVLAGMDRGIPADIIAPVPDSGKAYALYYALFSHIPYLEALDKYQYAGRSYIRPGTAMIKLIAYVKMTVVKERARGNRIVLLDDSIRRGSQLMDKGGPIDLLRSAGAKEIHLRIASPKNIKYCRCSPPGSSGRYEDEELAANMFDTDEKIAEYLGVNSVKFIGFDDFEKSITSASRIRKEDMCWGCYTGDFKFLE